MQSASLSSTSPIPSLRFSSAFTAVNEDLTDGSGVDEDVDDEGDDEDVAWVGIEVEAGGFVDVVVVMAVRCFLEGGSCTLSASLSFRLPTNIEYKLQWMKRPPPLLEFGYQVDKSKIKLIRYLYWI